MAEWRPQRTRPITPKKRLAALFLAGSTSDDNYQRRLQWYSLHLSLDALESPFYASLVALVYDYAGEKEKALALQTRLLLDPGAFLNVYALKHDVHSTLHGDPHFEALLIDPANNAPLF